MARKVDNNLQSIPYQTLDFPEGSASCDTPAVVQDKKIIPVSNFPTVETWDASRGGYPDKPRDLQVYKLEQRVRELEDNQRQDVGKLDRVLTFLEEWQRCYENGLSRGMWETYGQMELRLAKCRALIAMIRDPIAAPQVRWKEAQRL